MSADEAMTMVERVYGKETREKVEHATMARAGIVVGSLLALQLGSIALNFRRRARDQKEIEAVGTELMKQVQVVIDQVYIWGREHLQSYISRADGRDVLSREFCSHIVWSWMIGLQPELREFAPPSYVHDTTAGEKVS